MGETLLKPRESTLIGYELKAIDRFLLVLKLAISIYLNLFSLTHGLLTLNSSQGMGTNTGLLSHVL